MTATQARLQAGQVQSGLSLAAAQKSSLFEQLQFLWIEYTGEEATGSLEVAPQALEQRFEPQQIEQIRSLSDGGYLSKQTALQLLQRGGVLPLDFDIEEEIQGLESSDRAALEGQLARDQELMREGIMLPPNQFTAEG
jgi:hypothetical protein